MVGLTITAPPSLFHFHYYISILLTDNLRCGVAESTVYEVLFLLLCLLSVRLLSLSQHIIIIIIAIR